MSNNKYFNFNKMKRNLAFDYWRLLQNRVEHESLDELVTELMDLLPESSFDAVQPFDIGRLFLSSPIYEESVSPFIDDLYRVHLNLDESEAIEITLNSGGGDVYAGESLIGAIQTIQSMGRKVNITVHGLAASMASVLLQVASVRRIGSNSSIMLHEVSSTSRGKLSTQAEDLEATQKLQDRLFAYYAIRTGRPISYYRDKLAKKDLYMHADEALAEGLVDEIVQPPKYTITPPQGAGQPTKTKRSTKRG